MENSFLLRKEATQLFPAFQRFPLHHFTLMKDWYWYLFSLTKKNLAFMRKVKVKIGFRVCFVAVSHYGDSTHPKQQESHCQTPFLGTAGSISASSHHSFEMCLWASVLFLDLFCASVSRMCPKVTASSLCIFSAFERFHRNALLLDSGGNLYFHLLHYDRFYIGETLLLQMSRNAG